MLLFYCSFRLRRELLLLTKCTNFNLENELSLVYPTQTNKNTIRSIFFFYSISTLCVTYWCDKTHPEPHFIIKSLTVLSM